MRKYDIEVRSRCTKTIRLIGIMEKENKIKIWDKMIITSIHIFLIESNDDNIQKIKKLAGVTVRNPPTLTLN